MKHIVIVILFFGLLITALTGFTLVTSEKVAPIGELEITADKSNSLVWSPVISVVVMVISVGIHIINSKTNQGSSF